MENRVLGQIQKNIRYKTGTHFKTQLKIHFRNLKGQYTIQRINCVLGYLIDKIIKID